jgi:hypothetical protein
VDFRFEEREVLELDVSDTVDVVDVDVDVVVADADDFSIGVFNILLPQTECLVHVS